MGDKIKYQVFVEHVLHGTRVLTPEQIYRIYLETDRWAELRIARLAIDLNRCRLCDETATHVHHRVYPKAPKVYGEESVDDLTSLCDKCHSNYHYPPSIKEVRDGMLKSVSTNKGMSCPCCGELVKIYKRPLNSCMARGLIWLRKECAGKEWVHVPTLGPKWLVSKGGTLATMAHWELVEQLANHERSKKSSGNWRVTQKGIDFCMMKITVPKYVHLLFNEVVKFSGEQVDIRQSLGEEFDYEELMNS